MIIVHELNISFALIFPEGKMLLSNLTIDIRN